MRADVRSQSTMNLKFAKISLALLLAALALVAGLDRLFQLGLFLTHSLAHVQLFGAALIALVAAALYISDAARMIGLADALLLGLTLAGVGLIYQHAQAFVIWLPLLLLFVIFHGYITYRKRVRETLVQLSVAFVIVMPILALLDFQSLQLALNQQLGLDWYLAKAFIAILVVWLVTRLLDSWRQQQALQEDLDISSAARNWALEATNTLVVEIDLESGFGTLLGGEQPEDNSYEHKPVLTLFADSMEPEEFVKFRALQQHPYNSEEFTILDPNTLAPQHVVRLSFSQPYTRRGKRFQMLYSQDITEDSCIRLEAQSALAKLESLTETLGIGLFERDPVSDRYSCNHTWRLQRDLPEDKYPEIDLAAALHCIPAEDLKEHKAYIERVLVKPGVHSRVQRVVYSDGTERWLKLIAKPIYNADKLIRMVGCNIDVTDQIVQQQVLENLYTQQSALVTELKDELITTHLMGQVAGLGRFTYDPRERTISLSPEAQNLMGLPLLTAHFEDLVKRCSDRDAHLMVSFSNRIGLLSINHITTADVETGDLKSKARGSQIESEPVEILDAKGRSRWVKLIAASYQLDNNPVDVVGCVLDVTDEAREQRKSEDRFYELKKAAEAANIHVYEEDLTTSEGMLITDPTRYPTGSGTPLVGAHLRTVVPPDYRIEVDRFYEAVGYTAEFPLDLPDGRGRVWFKQQMVRRFKRGGAERAVVIALDVTSEHQIKALLESSLNESEALIREMREQRERQRRMFAVIGHELRTPAATLRMLLNDQQVAELEPHGAEIDDVTNHLLAVLDDLRAVVRPEGSEIGEISEDNPEMLLQRALGPLKALFSEHRLNTHINVSAVHYSELSGNYQALRQIVTNLAKNSALYSGASDLWVTASTQALEDERVLLQVRVEDNGKGIEPSVVDRLFGAFARGESDRDGTGLGLFISRDLARKMGGDVIYQEREGGGACFILTAQLRLPGSTDSVEVGTQMVSEELLQGKRVLVAEDNKMLQMLTRKLLEKLGAEVEVAENGLVALERAEVANFDLLLSDIFMPEMDGYALARQMRKRNNLLPIIGVSAATIGEETDKMLASGADLVVAKPLGVEMLLRAYAEILQEREQRSHSG